MIPVNPFCWSKSAKHDVTLTSLTADLLWPGSQFFDTMCGIVVRRGMASFKAKFSVLQELFAKKHRGGPFAAPPPPSGARVNTNSAFWRKGVSGAVLNVKPCLPGELLFTLLENTPEGDVLASPETIFGEKERKQNGWNGPVNTLARSMIPWNLTDAQWASCGSKPGSTKPGATEMKSCPYWGY